MEKAETESSVSKSLYQHPGITIIALDAPVPLLGLSEVSDGRLNAVFDNNYEEEDASEAF